jgi:hypothetical protein
MTTTTSTDPRYTDEALESYSISELREHLGERQTQLASARAIMKREHDKLGRMTADQLDGRDGTDTLANLSRATGEHASLRRIIWRLEGELNERVMAIIGDDVAHSHEHAMPVNLVDHLIGKTGLPCGVEEAGDLELARRIWTRAYHAIEQEHFGETLKQAWVAQRVADTYATLYGHR